MLKGFSIRYYVFGIFVMLSCDRTITDNETGDMIPKTSFSVSDFQTSDDCKTCHPDQYNQWSRSMHSFTAKDAKFFRDWAEEQHKRPNTGENFCAQCHLPIAFLADISVAGYSTPDAFQGSGLPAQVTEAVSCSFCHSMVQTSTSVHTDPALSGNAAAAAEYFLYPGEGIQFGPIADPESNSYHESVYSPIYNDSEVCLPCHNHIIRNKLIETTFSEWNSNSFVAMTGEPSCQSCHMQEYVGSAAVGSKERTLHNHSFAGVNIDLSSPIDEGSQWYKDTSELLKTALVIEYVSSDTLFTSLNADSLDFLVSINSTTAHNIPTGNAFVREAWLELVVICDQDTILVSGLVDSNTSDLDLDDDNLVLFTSQLLDIDGNITDSASDAYDFVSTQLTTYGSVQKNYKIPTDLIDIGSTVSVSARMLFRPYKPALLAENHPSLLSNLPIFEMFSVTETYTAGPVNSRR